jgi:uridine monophosphate synthetase
LRTASSAISAVCPKLPSIYNTSQTNADLNPTDTVQLQYTAGPLSIVRWAPIVNAHIFPGPAVITSLAEAAQKAIAAYNTSVSTDISASPTASGLNDESDSDSEEEESEDGTNENTTGEESSSDDRTGSRRNSRQPRKHSVVSVSTTISTKTETISPQPSSMRPNMSSRGGSTSEDPSSPDNNGMATIADDDEASEEDRLAALEHLGSPPYFRALLLLAQMSSKDNFFFPQYTDACATHARLNRNFVMGFIAQKTMNAEEGDNFITMTPGVQKSAGGDGKGQQYNTPMKVVAEAGADVIIVGRGVLNAPDRKQEAMEYRKQGWAAYEERLRAGRKMGR